MQLVELLNELTSYEFEKEWFEFKSNMKSYHEIGEYISAISNSAALLGKKEGYLIWGIDDTFNFEFGKHLANGTKFDFDSNADNNEPLKHYLERQIKPSIKINFVEEKYENKRVVVLVIGAARTIPTSFDSKRYIRIGSSKVDLSKFPEKEVDLFYILREGIPTITNTKSKYQKLTFSKLFGFYGSKGIILKETTFKKNLELLTEDGSYNILAQLLSDNSQIPLRVSIFDGETKASNLFSVREFGYNCLLYTLDELLRYGDVLNIIQADERNRVVERKDVPLFDSKAFNEAIINAVLHNKWIEGNEPMISVYSNRIEILSRGTLAPTQTMDGFLRGESVPVNEKLSEIFLQLHISEKSGRGVPKIVETYGKDAITFNENSIVVTIPFNWINVVGNKVGIKVGNKNLSSNRQKIINELRNNPNITKVQLSTILGISTTAIDKNLVYLKNNGFIERIGSKKTGYWKVTK